MYKTEWNPIIGEELRCRVEEDNAFNRFAVAISKDGRIVGHVLYLENWLEYAGTSLRKYTVQLSAKSPRIEDDQKLKGKDWLFQVFISSATNQITSTSCLPSFQAQVR